MGSFDRAETCEILGAYLLYELSKTFAEKIVLYRDDGLAAINSTQIDIEKKETRNLGHFLRNTT